MFDNFQVFLGYTDKVGQFSQKRLIIYLRCMPLLLLCVHQLYLYRILIVIGLLWLVLSVPLNILRVYSLKLLSRDTYFYYLTSYNTRYLEDLYSQRMYVNTSMSLLLQTTCFSVAASLHQRLMHSDIF